MLLDGYNNKYKIHRLEPMHVPKKRQDLLQKFYAHSKLYALPIYSR